MSTNTRSYKELVYTIVKDLNLKILFTINMFLDVKNVERSLIVKFDKGYIHDHRHSA